MKLKVYFWDMEFGNAIAVAPDIATAREQVMNQLGPDDLARPDLAEALKARPKMLGSQPLGLLNYMD